MDRGGDQPSYEVLRQVRRFGHVGGAVDRGTGNIVSIPWQLAEARMIDSLCQRYSCLPSQLMKEDAATILHIMKIRDEAGDNEDGE